jgi:hypothetical protein
MTATVEMNTRSTEKTTSGCTNGETMRVEKTLTINIGNYESLKLGILDAPTFEDADKALIAELERLKIPVDSKIKQALSWQVGLNHWMSEPR